jgi:hypothetical protein
MDEFGEEGDRARERRTQPELRPAPVELRQETDGQGKIAGIGASIFREPPLTRLPGQEPRQPLPDRSLEIRSAEALGNALQAEDDQRLVI